MFQRTPENGNVVDGEIKRVSVRLHSTPDISGTMDLVPQLI